MKFLTYFLPQFYATPENDKYWGKGFTDWVNVNNAKPLFKDHKQPLLPINNEFYDLSDVKVLENHSELSIKHGIDGFGYWHYWFDTGNKTLEKVQEMHLKNKSIKQNFFLAWANTDWTKSWVGDDKTVIFKQKYSKESAANHFIYLKQFILDMRYIKLGGLPIFQVINPDSDGAKQHILELERAANENFGYGFHWFFPANKNIDGLKSLTFSLIGFPPGDVTVNNFIFRVKRKFQKFNLLKGPVVLSQKSYLNSFKKTLKESLKNDYSYIPTILSGWDNTPRYNHKGFLINGNISSILTKQLAIIKNQYSLKNKFPEIILIKAWNEWAEGNIMEPYSYNGKNEFPSEIIKDIKEN